MARVTDGNRVGFQSAAQRSANGMASLFQVNVDFHSEKSKDTHKEAKPSPSVTIP